MKVEISDYTDEGQKVEVCIDPWDSWAVDDTLAHIIVPLLKQLKETTHSHPSELSEQEWDSMLGEMIWAFEQKLINWEDQYVIQQGEIDYDAMNRREDGNWELKWKREHIVDWDARTAHQQRMSHGFRMFGEWYESLWD